MADESGAASELQNSEQSMDTSNEQKRSDIPIEQKSSGAQQSSAKQKSKFETREERKRKYTSVSFTGLIIII